METRIRMVGARESEVHALIRKIFPEAEVPGPQDEVFVAEAGGKLAGFLRVCIVQGRTVINGLGVLPEYRERGLGTRLLEEAIAYLDGKGVAEVYLKVKEGNFKALSVYNRMGFIPLKIGRAMVLVRRKSS
ncbi:MAG: GNAT family N-acetyltransferase [Candidatus Bilamarchaeaceae archaeon]